VGKQKIFSLRNKVNHYFSDGGILTKFEFVFETRSPVEQLKYAELKAMLKEVLDMQISIRNAAFKYGQYTFKNCFKGLRELQVASTTLKKHFDNGEQAKYILQCTPQIFVSLNKREAVPPPRNNGLAIALQDANQSTLAGWWEKYNNHPYKIWLLKNNGPADNQLLQSIRNGILRIHSEKECINNVIQSVLSGYLNVAARTPESDGLQTFLNNKIRDVDSNFKKIQSLEQTKQVEMFIKEAYNKFNPGEITLLHESVKKLGFRPQVQNKVVNHIVKNAYYIEEQNFNVVKKSQKVVIGKGANVSAPISQQMDEHTTSAESFKEYYYKLSEILEKLAAEPNSYEKQVAELNLKKAQEAAVAKDESSFTKHLKAAGKWTADFASKVGASLVTELIKAQMKEG
jgi:hypothetical protein